MTEQTGVGRRIQQAILHQTNGEWESALVNLFPAIDKTAKLRRPMVKAVGDRIRGFFTDDEGFISLMATGNVFIGMEIDGQTMPQVLYEFGRCSLLHEGELDPKLRFNTSGLFSLGEVWNLPVSYISAMTLSVILAPENAGESIDFDAEIPIPILDERLRLSSLWGKRAEIHASIARKFVEARQALRDSWMSGGE